MEITFSILDSDGSFIRRMSNVFSINSFDDLKDYDRIETWVCKLLLQWQNPDPGSFAEQLQNAVLAGMDPLVVGGKLADKNSIFLDFKIRDPDSNNPGDYITFGVAVSFRFEKEFERIITALET